MIDGDDIMRRDTENSGHGNGDVSNIQSQNIENVENNGIMVCDSDRTDKNIPSRITSG